MEDAKAYRTQLCTGPVMFKLMMIRIMYASKEVIKYIETKLEKFTLKAFDGENIDNMASWLCDTMRFLKANNATPYNELGLVARALSSSSAVAYNQLVDAVYNNHCLGVKTATVKTMLHHAVEDYNT